MGRAKRTDGNQKSMVQALRKCGFTVAITSSLGEGFPDLVVGKKGRTRLVEVKDPAKPPSARKLTEDEQAFHDRWPDKVIIALTVEDVLNQFYE